MRVVHRGPVGLVAQFRSRLRQVGFELTYTAPLDQVDAVYHITEFTAVMTAPALDQYRETPS